MLTSSVMYEMPDIRLIWRDMRHMCSGVSLSWPMRLVPLRKPLLELDLFLELLRLLCQLPLY